jgi:Protein of unknown function (DUF1593)
MQKDTEGSEFIKQALLDDDPRPVFLQVWGGTNTVAAALRSIEHEHKCTRRWRSVYKRLEGPHLHHPRPGRDIYEESFDVAFSQARFIPALQNELAARAEWQTKSYDEANHPPEVDVAGKLDISVRPGERIELRGRTSDPDGDKLVTRWWHYREAGSYPDVVDISRPNAARTSFVVPRDASPGQTIH